jgi:MoxR-like ATPase
LPADILGTRVYDAQSGTFRIEKGPIFTNILLADEINRATPKTQSALLEAMQERQVTLADTTFKLDDPFWVLATQNPVEQEGVYSLPEAQLDRFCMMLRVGYPSAGEEVEMLRQRFQKLDVARQLAPGDVVRIRTLVRDSIHIDEKVLEYVVRLGQATRNPESVGLPHLRELVLLGMSPRSYQHVLALARVNAFLHGRGYVLPGRREGDLPRRRAPPHRAHACAREAEGVTTDTLVREICRRGRGPLACSRPPASASCATSSSARAQDPQPARRHLPQPPARARLRLRRAPAVPARRRRAADGLERHGAALHARSSARRTPSAS